MRCFGVPRIRLPRWTPPPPYALSPDLISVCLSINHSICQSDEVSPPALTPRAQFGPPWQTTYVVSVKHFNGSVPLRPLHFSLHMWTSKFLFLLSLIVLMTFTVFWALHCELGSSSFFSILSSVGIYILGLTIGAVVFDPQCAIILMTTETLQH